MIPDRVQSGMSSLWFLHCPSCNSAFECTVFTWPWNETKAIPDRACTCSRSESKLSFQCEILSRNHVNRYRSLFRSETGSLPGQRTRSLVFLWFSAVLLRALYLVRLRSVWVRSVKLSCKHGTKCCFSFRIELDLVSCKQPLSQNLCQIWWKMKITNLCVYTCWLFY